MKRLRPNSIFRVIIFRCWAMALAAYIALLPGKLLASSVSFAQFSEANPGGNLFSYLDNGPGQDSQFGTSTGGPLGASIPINFTYLTVGGSLPADLTGTQAATLTMTSSSTSPVVTGFGGAFGDQQVFGGGSVIDLITITRNSPAAEGLNTRTNLLSIIFTGQLIGALGGRTPQFSSDSSLAYTVSYSSDFIAVSTLAERDFSLTFSSWTSLADNGGLEISNDGYFAAATASGAGTFDGQATVITGAPEPASGILATIAGGLVIFGKARREHFGS